MKKIIIFSIMLLMLPVVFAAYNVSDPATNKLRLSFTNSIVDISGNNVPIDISNASSIYGLDKNDVNNQAKFFNSSENIRANVSAITDTYTISFWLNSTYNSVIIYDYRDTLYDGVYVRTNTDNTTSCYHNTYETKSTTTIDLNQWYHIVCVQNGSEISIYVDGVKENSTVTSGDLDVTYPNTVIGSNLQNAGYIQNSFLDEFNVWNYALTENEINQLYMGYDNYYYEGISVSSNISDYSAGVNTNTFDVNVSVNGFDVSNSISCSVYSNNTDVTCDIGGMAMFNPGGGAYRVTNETTVTCTLLDTIEEYVTFTPYCYNSSDSYNATAESLLLDIVLPQITMNYPNPANTTQIYLNSMPLNISVIDPNNYVTWVNITRPDSTNIYSHEYNTTDVYQYNITDSITNHSTYGNYTLLIQSADGHTDQMIDTYNYNLKDKVITFKEQDEINIYAKNKENFLAPSLNKLDDRYEFSFKQASKSILPYDEFYVETKDSYIDIIEGSKYPGHIIIREGDITNWKWVDFNTDEGYPVEVERISDTKVKVRVYGGGKDYNFKSIGGLNVINQTVIYYYEGGNYSVTEIYENYTISNISTQLFANITYNGLIWSSINSAKLQYNGTNYTANEGLSGDYYTGGWTNYSIVIVPDSNPTDHDDIEHVWWFNLSKVAGGSQWVSSDTRTQDEYRIELGECAGYIDEEILNVTFRDEQTNATIVANYSFIGAGYDNIQYYNISPYVGENSSIKLCTNLHDTIASYNWEYVGDITLLSTYDNVTYVPRVFSFSAGSGITMSNDPARYSTLYLIGVENSSTVTYTWNTYQSEPVNGDMQVYMCNIDGSKSLVESIPIVSGKAVANLELYTQQYSYTVIISGETYTEPSGWSRCHVESSTDLTYYVDVIPDTATPALGLNFVSCDITKQSNNTVSMTFGSSSASTETINGCIVAYRDTIYNKTEIYRNCTDATGDYTTITRTIPDNDNSYYVTGLLYQNGYVAQCKDTVSFFIDSNDRDSIGLEGLFFVVILIMALALIYAGDGILQLSGAGVGLIASYVLGLLILDWIVVISLLAILVSIAMIGRANRR